MALVVYVKTKNNVQMDSIVFGENAFVLMGKFSAIIDVLWIFIAKMGKRFITMDNAIIYQQSVRNALSMSNATANHSA